MATKREKLHWVSITLLTNKKLRSRAFGIVVMEATTTETKLKDMEDGENQIRFTANLTTARRIEAMVDGLYHAQCVLNVAKQ